MNYKHIAIAILLTAAATSLIIECNRTPEPIQDGTEAQMWRERYRTQKGLADVLYQRGQVLAKSRDTIYQDRVVVQTKWRERISVAPPDSLVYYERDSCKEVGMLVLKELDYAKEELKVMHAAYDTLSVSNEAADHIIAIQDKDIADLQRKNKRSTIFAAVGYGIAIGLAIFR
jgi:hypothetical protein